MYSHTTPFISITCSFCCVFFHVLAVKVEFSTISYHKYFIISNSRCLGRIFLSSCASILQYLYHAWCVDSQPLSSLLHKLTHPTSAFSSLGSDIFPGRPTLLPKTPKEITTYWWQYFYFQALIRLICGATVRNLC